MANELTHDEALFAVGWCLTIGCSSLISTGNPRKEQYTDNGTGVSFNYFLYVVYLIEGNQVCCLCQCIAVKRIPRHSVILIG